MAKTGYTINSPSVALTAATARSVLGVRAGSAFGIQLTRFNVSFDGVTASAVPVYVELCYATFATNPPGTASTSIATPNQVFGRVLAAGTTQAHTWTTEPTVLTTNFDFWLDPYKGIILYDWALGNEPDSGLSEGFVLRCTAPANVNVRASLRWERI